MERTLFIVTFFILSTITADCQVSFFQVKPGDKCESHYKSLNYRDSLGNVYSWAEPHYTNEFTPVANRQLTRIDRVTGDTLTRCFADNNGFTPYAFIIVNKRPRMVYVKSDNKSVQVATQLIDQNTLQLQGEPTITFVRALDKSAMEHSMIYLEQSEDFSKTVFYYYSYTNKTKDCETVFKSFDESWQIITDTAFKLANYFAYPKNGFRIPMVEINNMGNIFLVAKSSYVNSTEATAYGHKKEDMLVARITGNSISPLDFDFTEFFTSYTLKAHGNAVVFAGTCCFGKPTFAQWATYGTFTYVFDQNNDKASHSLIRRAEENYSANEGNDQVKYLLLCDVLFTGSEDKFWLITQSYWDAEKEFICNLMTFDAKVISTSKVYRNYSRAGMGYGRAGIEWNVPYPLQGYSIVTSGKNLQIFFHDNPSNDLKSNSPSCKEMNFDLEKYNLIVAEVTPEGSVTKSLIHQFNGSEPEQQHNSVLVYRDYFNTYHFRSYQKKDKTLEMYSGFFRLNNI
jgi:hypothetical protein